MPVHVLSARGIYVCSKTCAIVFFCFFLGFCSKIVDRIWVVVWEKEWCGIMACGKNNFGDSLKFRFSLDVILSGWLGSKHQLTNSLGKGHFHYSEQSSDALVSTSVSWQVWNDVELVNETFWRHSLFPSELSPVAISFLRPLCRLLVFLSRPGELDFVSLSLSQKP